MKISILEDATPSPLDELVTYRSIIEGAPVMLWLGDREGKCLFLNREQREFWGLSAADVADFNWATTVHPDDIEVLAKPFQEAMAAQRGFETEARYRRADGEYRTLRTRARPRFSQDGEFIGMAGVNTDITDRLNAEERLRRSNEQLEFALNSSRGIGTWVWEPQTGVIRVDRRFADVFGLDLADAEAGLPPGRFLDAIDDDDRHRVFETFTRAFTSGQRFECEYRLKPRSGMPTCVMAMGGAEVDNEGRSIRLAGIAVDMTESKARESQLALLTRELSHRIKNVFTIVTSLTSMAEGENPDAAPVLRKLRDRFAAMSAAYSLVIPGEPGSGMKGRPQLHKLIETLLAPYREGDDNRILIECEDIPLGQKSASSLALIIHELATNSVKYGALSGGGRVKIFGIKAANGRYKMVWEENGGPKVDGAPASAGFGSSLIDMSAMTLDAEIDPQWPDSGLVWTLIAPESSLLPD